jgi:hypothetical protein
MTREATREFGSRSWQSEQPPVIPRVGAKRPRRKPAVFDSGYHGAAERDHAPRAVEAFRLSLTWTTRSLTRALRGRPQVVVESRSATLIVPARNVDVALDVAREHVSRSEARRVSTAGRVLAGVQHQTWMLDLLAAPCVVEVQP